MRSHHLLAALLGAALACQGASTAPSAPATGTERGACRPDDGCDVGLECWSQRCVRPPGAACDAVARRLSGYRLGNYATDAERAPVVAELARQCQAAQLTAREGRCLSEAATQDVLITCPRVLLPELEAAQAAARAPHDPWAPR